jgi:hypothetical protein
MRGRDVDRVDDVAAAELRPVLEDVAAEVGFEALAGGGIRIGGGDEPDVRVRREAREHRGRRAAETDDAEPQRHRYIISFAEKLRSITLYFTAASISG